MEINAPDFDPNQGLVPLPAELVDASNQIAAGCAAGGESMGSNEFTITGRGGLPPNPREPLGGEAVLTNWATLEGAGSREQGRAGEDESRIVGASFIVKPGSKQKSGDRLPSWTHTQQIVEATGWVMNDKGEVVLTATAPTATPDIPWLTPVACHR